MRPTGRAVDLDGMDMLWVRDGRIERIEVYMDGMTMARQLGAMPPKDSRARTPDDSRAEQRHARARGDRQAPKPRWLIGAAPAE